MALDVRVRVEVTVVDTVVSVCEQIRHDHKQRAKFQSVLTPTVFVTVTGTVT